MDESTLRIYFRRVLAVPAGASRKVLRSARDRRAALWREKMLATTSVNDSQGKQKELFEQRLSITNTAYDALSDSVRFKTFFTRLQAGVESLPDLDELLVALGEGSIKPPPARVIEKRQAAVMERMQRAQTLLESAIRQAVESEAKKLQAAGVPDSDQFYDAIYAAAIAAGNQAKDEEVAAAARTKVVLDEHCQSELDALITDTSEMAAHRAYDRLEAQVASQAEPQPANRSVALVLSLLILGLVFGAAYYALNKDPGAFIAANQTNAVSGLTAVDASNCEAISEGTRASDNARIASGGGLIATAGAAGLGGSANNVSEEGQVHYHDGVQAAISGATTQALADFEQAYKLSPGLTLALYNKAALLAISCQFKAAIADYSEVLSQKPNLAQAYYNRGLAHQNLASQVVSKHAVGWQAEAGLDLRQAIANYDCCLRINSRCAQAFYNRGFANYCLGQFAQAYSDFEKAQGLLPMLEAANFNKNAVAAVLKKPVEPIPNTPPGAPIGPVGPPWQ